MQLKLAPHNAPWQWKVIQGEVAKRHIATFFCTIFPRANLQPRSMTELMFPLRQRNSRLTGKPKASASSEPEPEARKPQGYWGSYGAMASCRA